ncbi:siderophore-iron reductase FhuF [Janthinobacterium agaricidamnosum]|uniref:Ferric iron reductase protein FhuF n=1 Tax=Janthinobacterium agaricidamnosum NBRC 102515 = DSM 9628 TaxID=1349767 RepID=W0V3C3_9BURK|nr:siderophore-iron reductase FhuF [Janthinobacterium agaricidamnosum]CDG82371.1 ferric iron reductase protein FhuF [Janthinobacterium agaricidamnosum NBRC 102515 = DSM 9628]
MIALLEPLFQGPWRPYGSTLSCGPPAPHGLAVSRLLDEPGLLDRLLRGHARRLGTDDLRPAASSWSNAYLEALLPPVAAAATLLHHLFPATAADMALTLDQHGAPAAFHIATLGARQAGAGAHRRYHALLDGHLAPLFAQLRRRSGVPEKILWGNVARLLDNLLREAAALPGAAGAMAASDSAALLDEPQRPDGSRNPLYTRPRRVLLARPGGQQCVTLHRQCCLYYLLPGEGYCGRCPLDPQYRGLKAAAPGA